MPRFLRDTGLILSTILLFVTIVLAAEEITITTYYPSPYGSYNSLQVDKLGVGDNNGDGFLSSADVPTTSGDVWIKGKVGIGTTSPGAKLDVSTASTTGIGRALLGVISSGWWGGQGVGNYFGGWATDTQPLFKVESWHGSDPRDKIFQVARSGDTPYLTVQGGGNVGIGTTSPSYQLQLSTDSAAKPTTNTWTIASDERVKKNIADFRDGLDVVMKLKPRTYQYNGLGGPGYNDTATHIGFVAQELEPVAPYMVETREGSIGTSRVSDFKSYQGHALPFILVNAVQEQQKQIESLKEEIKALKSSK